jgi:hypothetical protein
MYLVISHLHVHTFHIFIVSNINLLCKLLGGTTIVKSNQIEFCCNSSLAQVHYTGLLTYAQSTAERKAAIVIFPTYLLMNTMGKWPHKPVRGANTPMHLYCPPPTGNWFAMPRQPG